MRRVLILSEFSLIAECVFLLSVWCFDTDQIRIPQPLCNVFSDCRMCSLIVEYVLLPQNVFFFAIECVLLP